MDRLTSLSISMRSIPLSPPGVSHPEPGGLSVREVLDVIRNVSGDIVGADIVEYNPTRDIQGLTALVAAKFCKELLARLIDQKPIKGVSPQP
jgi:arginase